MRTLIVFSLAALLALPAAAHAAAPNGSYKGSSTGKVWDRAAMDDVTDKGTVAFSVRSNAVQSFKVSGQKFMCGGQPVEIKITAARIKLDSAGRGKATFKDASVGSFKISITVKSTGRVTGSVIAVNLCDGENYPVKFTARKR